MAYRHNVWGRGQFFFSPSELVMLHCQCEEKWIVHHCLTFLQIFLWCFVDEEHGPHIVWRTWEAFRVIAWVNECYSCGFFWIIHIFSSAAAYKNVGPIFTGFSTAEFKMYWSVKQVSVGCQGFGKYGKRTYKSSSLCYWQGFSAQLTLGQVTASTSNLLLTLMCLCNEIWCHSVLTTF